MELMEKQGFKQTEVGLIPEDWEVISIYEAIKNTQLGGNYKNTENETDYPLMKMGNLDRGFFKFNKIEYVVGQKPDERDLLKYGDVIFNTRNTLDLVGKVAVWKNELDKAYFNSNLLRFEFNENKISSSFFFNYLINTKRNISQLRAIATGTTSVAAIYTRDLTKVKIAIPTLEEQKAIATALSDVDELITNLDKLIAKKKAIKQGAMQQLLTPPHKGGKRLEGFSGEWEEKKLGDIAEINGAGVDKKIIAGEKSVRLFNYMDIMKRDYVYDYELNHEVTAPYSKINSCNVLKGDIFLTPSSELRTDIGVSAIAMENMIGVVYSYHVYRLRYTIVINKLFGLYLLKTKDFLDQAEKMCEGSGKRYVVSMGKFKNMTIYYPKDIEEQISISNILYDIDKEIEQLKSKKAKCQSVKQGIMQELLTGKTRLI